MDMEPPLRPWQPVRGILTLIVVLALGFVTFYLINPVQWIIYYSEFNMLLAIYMVFVILFLNGYVTGWPGRMYTPAYQLGWLGKKFTTWYQRGKRGAIHSAVLAGLIIATYFILRFSVGPNFPWMLFFEIQALFVFLAIALLFANWPLHKLRQPAQGLGLLAISLVLSVILYYTLHNYGPFYASAQNVPPPVLAVLLAPGTTPAYLASINPNGAYEAFFMATMNTMFLLYIVLIFFLFDMWPFRLLGKQPWVGLSALAGVVVLSVVTWNILLVVWPQIITVDVGLLSAAGFAPPGATGLAPLAALPPPAQFNISELYTLGAFEGPLIVGALIWSVVFLWWPTLTRTREVFGRAPYNRQPWKGLILTALSAVTAYLLYVGIQGFAFTLQPPIAWQIPGLVPPPFLSLLWLVINFLPGLATYILFYGVVWESWPQPPLPPPPPDFLLYKVEKRVAPLDEKKKAELASKYVR